MKINNDVETRLATGISDSADEITINNPPSPFNLPATPDSDPSIATLINSLASPTQIEIIHYTGLQDNEDGTHTLTGVIRGREDTEPAEFLAGAYLIQAPTAGTIAWLVDLIDASSGGGGGEATEARAGTARIDHPSTEVDVAHGLGFTPVRGQIQVTPHDTVGGWLDGAASSKYAVRDLTASQFTIAVDAAPGVDKHAAFDWLVVGAESALPFVMLFTSNNNDDPNVHIWDIDGGELSNLRQHKFDTPVSSAALSPDGRWLVYQQGGGVRVRFRSVDAGDLGPEVALPDLPAGNTKVGNFSNTGRFLAVFFGNTAGVWEHDGSGGFSLVDTVAGFRSGGLCKISPDGAHLAGCQPDNGRHDVGLYAFDGSELTFVRKGNYALATQDKNDCHWVNSHTLGASNNGQTWLADIADLDVQVGPTSGFMREALTLTDELIITGSNSGDIRFHARDTFAAISTVSTDYRREPTALRDGNLLCGASNVVFALMEVIDGTSVSVVETFSMPGAPNEILTWPGTLP